MDSFESLFANCRNALERFVRFKISDPQDADEVIQDVSMAAYRGFSTLADKAAFRPWLIGIARNKCNDYFRQKSRSAEISLSTLENSIGVRYSYGLGEAGVVRETLRELAEKDRQILWLYFWQEYSQDEIARVLNLPLGTVKSRLHYAKKRFKEKYPYPPVSKGDTTMKKFPEKLPEYKIARLEKEPFAVKFEELTGWFIIPRLGEKTSWAAYDCPDRRLTEIESSEVIGKIAIHGVEGVEIRTLTDDKGNEYCDGLPEHIYYAQLTDTHCRWLGESYVKNGVKHLLTFLDGDEFIEEWGFGEDNAGMPVALKPAGDIVRDGDIVTAVKLQQTSAESGRRNTLADVVGTYQVTLMGKTYETVCLMMIYPDGAMTEQYIDKTGRTVLWRRFNRNNWAFGRYQQTWTAKLPQSETVTINGETFVHWYDCISDYVL